MADGGMFRGSRVQGADYFDDVMGDNEIPEMFRGGGMESLEKVVAHSTPEGMMLDMHCRPPGCGAQKGVLVGWPELFIIAHLPQTGIRPQGWRRSEVNHAVVPELACSRCGAPVAPVITHDWAQKQIDAALQAGHTSMEALRSDPQVQRLAQVLAQQHAQHAPHY